MRTRGQAKSDTARTTHCIVETRSRYPPGGPAQSADFRVVDQSAKYVPSVVSLSCDPSTNAVDSLSADLLGSSRSLNSGWMEDKNNIALDVVT
jgi:hypothetical protein